MLRNITYDDLSHIIEDREKLPWRNWDKYKVVKGSAPSSVEYQEFLKQYNRELNSFRKIEKIESNQEEDLINVVQINKDMTNFVVNNFGGDGWLKLIEA